MLFAHLKKLIERNNKDNSPKTIQPVAAKRPIVHQNRLTIDTLNCFQQTITNIGIFYHLSVLRRRVKF